MIPVKLEIEGLYSYKEKQTVEFEQLTGAGLFGIFGAVGSGKSSILEAILLALYGSTERLSDRGEKNSMLNLQSVTGGAFGIGFIPRPFADLQGNALLFSLANCGLMALVVLVLYLGLQHLSRSPWGRVLRAIREDARSECN